MDCTALEQMRTAYVGGLRVQDAPPEFAAGFSVATGLGSGNAGDRGTVRFVYQPGSVLTVR